MLNQYAIIDTTSANNPIGATMTTLDIIKNILTDNNVESNDNSATMYLNEANRVFDDNVPHDAQSDSLCLDRDAMIDIYEYIVSYDSEQ